MKKIAIVGCRPKHLTQQQIVDTKRDVEFFVYQNVIEHPGEIEFVSGGAGGVDTWAEDAARHVGVKCTVFPAKWKRPDGSTDYGAGHRRNAHIVSYADEVYAFWDGKSTGTKNTIELARKAGKLKTVFRVDE